MMAASLAVTAATLLSAYWPLGSGLKGIPWPLVGLVWAYVLVWSLIQDICKVLNNQALAACGLYQNLGIVDESLLEHKPGCESVGEIDANLGTPMDPPKRRRTSSLNTVTDTNPTSIGGFVEGDYKKGNASSFVSASSQQPGRSAVAQGVLSRDRTGSVEAEPQAHLLSVDGPAKIAKAHGF